MKRIGWFVGLLCAAVALGQSVRAEDAAEKIKKTGVLVVGVKDDAPPFGFRERGSGSIVGYDPDYVRAVGRKLGVRVELKPVTQANRLSELIDGSVDVVAANLTKSATRQAVIDFSDVYLVTGQKFLAKAGTIKTMKDLEGKKIGAIIGTPSEGCARAACEGGTLIPFDDYVQAVRALQAGTIDAFTTDQAILVDLLDSLPRGDYEIPAVQISRQEYVFGVRREDRGLVEVLNKAIGELTASGEAKEIYDRWFGIREERPSTAYGAIVRKAATPPRFLAVILNGFAFPKADVSIFALDGAYLGKGKVASVLGDEVYLDAERSIYDLVQPGFLITMNMTNEMSRDVVIQHLALLKRVKADSETDAEKIRAQAEREAIAKEKRMEDVRLMEKQSQLSVEEERARYYMWRRSYR